MCVLAQFTHTLDLGTKKTNEESSTGLQSNVKHGETCARAPERKPERVGLAIKRAGLVRGRKRKAVLKFQCYNCGCRTVNPTYFWVSSRDREIEGENAKSVCKCLPSAVGAVQRRVRSQTGLYCCYCAAGCTSRIKRCWMATKPRAKDSSPFIRVRQPYTTRCGMPVDRDRDAL